MDSVSNARTGFNATAEGHGEPSLQDQINALMAENAKLKAATTPDRLSLRVSEKGGLSVYGLGRFPVTLYREQWARLFDAKDSIEAFIKANSRDLKLKGEIRAAALAGPDQATS